MRHDTSMTGILQGAKMHANDLSHTCSRDRAVQLCMWVYPLSFSICVKEWEAFRVPSLSSAAE